MNRLAWFSAGLIAAVCWIVVTPAIAQHEHPAGDPNKLGKVSFPVSCDPVVQVQFSSAVAMLHSFWYEKASDTRKAGAILEQIFVEQPEHPGVAHYIIQAYDYPPLADKALEAAPLCEDRAGLSARAPHAIAHFHASWALAGVH